jgi:hypothetical protein
MSKVRDISNLSNVIRTDASGNVSFVSGSTTLATINTSGQLSGSSPVLSSSYALNATSASYAVSASNATNAVTASFANAFTVANTLTATTLVVQTVSSSVIYSSGSNIFGNNIANTQSFTGSVSMTGSLSVVTTGTEFQVNATGVKFGNVSTDSHSITGSMNVSGAFYITASAFQIASPSTAYGGAINLINTSNNKQWNITNVGSGTGTRNGNFEINNNSVDIFAISQSGNIGIGTTSPTAILQIQGAQAGVSGKNLTISYNGTYYAEYTEKSITAFNNELIFGTGTGGAERMRITSGGLVGIGTTNPVAPLSIPVSTTNSQISTGGIEIQSFSINNSWIGENVYYNNGFRARATGYTSQIYFVTDGGISFLTAVGQTTAGNTAGLTQRLNIAPSGAVAIYGSLSKGSGSFRIKHPLASKKNTHQLVHSFIEGPQADLIYSGGVTLVDGKAIINIDEAATMTEGTFEALNRNIRVFTSNETSWDNVRGKVVGNILTIECQNTESTDEVSWLVIGERQDEHIMDTEWTDENGKVIVEPLIPEEITTI